MPRGLNECLALGPGQRPPARGHLAPWILSRVTDQRSALVFTVTGRISSPSSPRTQTTWSWAQKLCAWEADIYCLYPPVAASPQLRPGQRRGVGRQLPSAPPGLGCFAFSFAGTTPAISAREEGLKGIIFFPFIFFKCHPNQIIILWICMQHYWEYFKGPTERRCWGWEEGG